MRLLDFRRVRVYIYAIAAITANVATAANVANASVDAIAVCAAVAAIATIAAIGNAGVPMGCFFLSASLLSTMGMDLALLGIILPFYSVIDMIETSLNVWSDICVTKIADQEA